MCSIGEDERDLQNSMIQEKNASNLSDICNKCKLARSSIVLRGKDVYCKNCFILNTTHKFKAELGKSKLIRPSDRVLVYHKLGHPSTSLLHFVRTGLDLNTPKKLRFEPIILFIEDQYQLTLEERQTVIEKVNKQIESFHFEQHFISLVNYILNPQNISKLLTKRSLNVTQDDAKKYSQTVEKKKSATLSIEWKSIYMRKLLVDAAKCFNCKFIFTPEISVDIASNLLANISLGRYQIANNTGFVDHREDVKIIRPLRQFDIKELAYYNTFNNIEPVCVREIKSINCNSVQDLTNNFVKKLQKNFPATVSTVVRTGDKLIVNNDSQNKCNLCKVNFEIKESLTADEAITFSKVVSETNFKEMMIKNTTSSPDNCFTCDRLFKL